jgi:hypothetical protein
MARDWRGHEAKWEMPIQNSNSKKEREENAMQALQDAYFAAYGKCATSRCTYNFLAS